MLIAQAEGISDEDTAILEVGAAFHDSGFLISDVDHELEGCRIVERVLPDFDFSTEEIERICSLIMATLVPQNPLNHLEQILCDADLDYLGRQDFPPISNTLYDEFKYRGVVNDPDAWMALQITFLKKHKYWTDYSQNTRNDLKNSHLKKLLEDWNSPLVE